MINNLYLKKFAFIDDIGEVIGYDNKRAIKRFAKDYLDTPEAAAILGAALGGTAGHYLQDPKASKKRKVVSTLLGALSGAGLGGMTKDLWDREKVTYGKGSNTLIYPLIYHLRRQTGW